MEIPIRNDMTRDTEISHESKHDHQSSYRTENREALLL
jgi:hypothetical protein